MDTIEAIKTRRSIRKFKAEPLSEEKLGKVLEAARWAPSWANTQCWELVVVKNPSIKEQLSKTLTPNNPAIPAILGAPVLIVALGQKGRSGFYKSTPTTDKGDWLMYDVALAMQNLCLAAHSLGLGTVHVGAFNAPEAEKILQVPPSHAVVAMSPLGVPEGEARLTPRRELKEFIHYDSFGHKA